MLVATCIADDVMFNETDTIAEVSVITESGRNKTALTGCVSCRFIKLCPAVLAGETSADR
jgi:hypothetical protein